MADMIKYLSLTGLSQYDYRIKEFVNKKVSSEVADAFKYVNLEDGSLKFYTINPILETTEPAFEIELPVQDLSNLMALVKDATAGNIAVFGEGGQVEDSGVAISSLATKEEVGGVQTSVDELAGLVGELPEGTSAKDVVDYVNIKTAGIATDTALEELNNQVSGLQTAVQNIQNDYLVEEDKTELQSQITTNADAIEVLNGDESVEGSVDKKVADAINEFATQITDDGTINTFKEVLNYISTHGGEATEMMAAIDTLETLVGDKAVATQIAEAIEAKNLDQYATDDELAEAIARIVVLEGASHTHENATELAKIADGDVEKWNKAEENAAAYTDAEIDKVEAVIGEVAEGKTVVEMISDAQVAATYDDAEIKADVAVNAEAIATLSQTHADDKAALLSADEAIMVEIEALKAVQHQEISVADIDELFNIDEDETE